MKRNRPFPVDVAWLVAPLLAWTPMTTMAAGLATADTSVVAMSTGGTGTARIDDPAAAYLNPAAAAMRPGFAASIGAVVAAPTLQAVAPAWSEDSVAQPTTPPHGHLSFATEHFAVGASFTVPFGSGVAWPEGWARRFDLISAQMAVFRATGFAAMRFGDFAIAAGPIWDNAILKLNRAIDFIDAEGRVSLDTQAMGFGGHLGLFYDATDWLNVGVSYRSRVQLDFDGYADFEIPAEFQQQAQDSAVTTRMTLPDRIAVGSVFNLGAELELAFDIEIFLWQTIQELVIDFEEEAMDDLVKSRQWEMTVAPRVGLTWKALDWLTLRAGGFVDPSPVPRDTVGPDTPDSTRLGISMGLGARIVDGIEIDMAYQRLVFQGAATAASEGETTTFEGGVHLAGIGLSFYY